MTGTAELVDQLRAMKRHALASVLRERLARHAGRADARREALERALSRCGASRFRPASRRRSNARARPPTTPRRSSARRRASNATISSPIRASSARATASRPPKVSRRSSSSPTPRRFCWIPPTRPRRWRRSSATCAPARSPRQTPSSSSTPAASPLSSPQTLARALDTDHERTRSTKDEDDEG